MTKECSKIYIAGPSLTPVQGSRSTDLSTEAQDLSAPARDLSAPPKISPSLMDKIAELKQREHDSQKIMRIILEICKDRFVTAKQIAVILKRGEHYLKKQFLSPMIESKMLRYKHPEMSKHPHQAYTSNQTS